MLRLTLPLAAFACFAAPSLAANDPFANVVFPEGANVADVADPKYGATPDDDTDDTEAFKKALQEEPFNWLIYVPNGRYLVSDELHWAKPKRRQVLQGQSQAGTVIQLKDGSPGFTNPADPKAMFWTGMKPAQRFRNGIRDLTIDTGKGNPGAIGARFIANNEGGIQRVTIRSGDPDGRGVIGLDLGYTDEQGPCLIKGVTVRGFDVGIKTKHGVDSVTLEHLTLEGQREVGFLNEGQVANLRGLTSRNRVPAFRNTGTGLLTLLDSELIGEDGPEGAAVVNEAGLFARNVHASGYASAIENTGGHCRSPEGLAVAEFNSHDVISRWPSAGEKSMALPIEETPEVPWDAPETWANVTDFGPPEPITIEFTIPPTVNPLVKPDYGQGKHGEPKPVKTVNWAGPLQRAIDSGATTVYFPHRPGKDPYDIFGEVRLRGNVRRLFGCETSLGHIVNSNRHRSRLKDPALIPTFIVEDGASDVVVIERFETWYTAPRVEQRSNRTLALKSMSIYDLETFPGTGDVFLEDLRAMKVTVNGTRLWARQLNTEGWEEPRNLINAGQMWVFGLKTESDSTVAQVQNGGQLEVCGAFIYANKNLIHPKVMFINRGGSLSATFGEFVAGGARPFNVIEHGRGDEASLMPPGEAHGRAGGSMATLLLSEVE